MTFKLFLSVSCFVSAFASAASWHSISSDSIDSSSNWASDPETVTDETPPTSDMSWSMYSPKGTERDEIFTASSSQSSVATDSPSSSWPSVNTQYPPDALTQYSSSSVATDSAGSSWSSMNMQDPPDATTQNSFSDEPVTCALSTVDRCRIERILNLTEALVQLVTEEEYTEEPQTSTGQSRVEAPIAPARDCSELGVNESGRYAIYPDDDGDPFFVYCDMETDGGGWTVFQRRQDGSVDFYRSWCDYKHGFGNMSSEFWLGNEKIHRLTFGGNFQLRVDLANFEGETRFAMYDSFSVGHESSDYLLTVSDYSGNAGDSLSSHSNYPFATKDHEFASSCAVDYHGAWWYEDCHNSNLNGRYLGGETSDYATGVVWQSWSGYYYSLRKTEMKIRRLG